MLEPVFLWNSMLRARLRVLAGARIAPPPAVSPEAEIQAAVAAEAGPSPWEPIDVVVSLNEINDRHGTGPLVKRVCGTRHPVFSIRSRDDWGVHDFGRWNARISQQGCSRPECFLNVLSVLGGRKVRNVLCVPFLVDEIMTSIAIKEAFDARLCVWVMDDQNVAATVVPDDAVRELLEKSSLRLATHPELRLAYERVPGLRTGALLGSFWDQVWFDRLCSILARLDWKIDWYGNNQSPWFKFPPKMLTRAGITAFGVIPEEQLAVELRRYPFVIVPVGALDGKESNTGVASLSLPGRILFSAAASHTPVLVVGSENTCGARFVKHFGIGETVPYEADAVGAAMERLSAPDAQRRMRANAAAIAQSFSDRGVPEWLEASIESGCLADRRYEDAFSGYDCGRDSPLADDERVPVGGGV
ncbi:MAG: hypothetical protein NTU88_11315 [Armatimonadetes bacterium]|nr:hypothetical protein [Armatimonadota bacterium]